jgi:hypothetical protein
VRDAHSSKVNELYVLARKKRAALARFIQLSFSNLVGGGLVVLFSYAAPKM